LYTSCVLWVAPLCAFSIYFTYKKKKILRFQKSTTLLAI